MTLAALIKTSQEDPESWHYTSLARFADLTFAKPAGDAATPRLPAPLTAHRLVFIDGRLSPEASTLGAMPDGFLSACSATQDCIVLTLSDAMCLALDPVELLFITTDASAPTEAHTTIKITLGASSRLTLIERHCGTTDAGSVRHIQLEVSLAAQAKLVHGKIIESVTEGLHFSRTQVIAQSGAFYDHVSLIAGGELARCEHDIALAGELAEARLYAIIVGRNTQHTDLTGTIRHLAPNTSSRQLCKAVLHDKARGVFQGKIHVAKGAQKTDGYQQCRALLLSDKAEMDAKPELEIFADDVKCSHGTAIGDLDENALFYLRSRGIDAASARALLIEAFVSEVIDACQSPEIANALRHEVSKCLS